MTQNKYHIKIFIVCFSSYLVTIYLIFNETQGNILNYEEVI